MRRKSHDLFDFMLSITKNMEREYDRIQKRATEDPGTAGDQGEENWATLLRDWLPPTYRIVTKGRILSHDGIASAQVDVLILHLTYPNHLLDKKLYLAGGVAAAFECKITLKSKHIRKAIENAAEIRRLLPPRTGTPYRELNSPIVYGMLAHSHSWKGEKSLPVHNIQKHLVVADRAVIQHPCEMIDLLCVADLATWASWKRSCYPRTQDAPAESELVGTSYLCYVTLDKIPLPDLQDQASNHTPFTPIGTMLSALLKKLAWEDVSIRRLADYFRLTEVGGRGGGTMRCWQPEIYSDQVRNKLLSGKVRIQKPWWDEWSVMF